jgi:3',5'-cyclic AMP phosphodiesterase CpdA
MRFIYLSDSHWGAGEAGYHLQPKYDEYLPDLLQALRDWIQEKGPIDFVLHGGDMIHATSDEAILAAADHFDLPIPVRLCLGNHDLTAAGALDSWQRLAPQFFGGRVDFAIKDHGCLIHVIPNQYGSTPFLWSDTQDPHFLPEQVTALEDRLSSAPDATHLILTHSPVFPIEPAQTGMEEPFHQPPTTFTDVVTGLAEKYGATCVLGAHSHANMHKSLNGVDYITVSSFVEAPFEFKLFEIDADSLSMETHNLRQRIDRPVDYDWDSTFVQGRACDRSFRKDLK